MQLLSFLFLFAFGFAPANGQSTAETGNRLALYIDASANRTAIDDQLLLASGLDIRIIETNGVLATPDDASIFYLFDTENYFLTTAQLKTESNEYSETVLSKIREARTAYGNRLLAISLLKYPHDNSSLFPESAQRFLDSLDVSTAGSQFYYHSIEPTAEIIPTGFDFISSRVQATTDATAEAPVVHFVPSENIRESLLSLETVLNRSRQFQSSIVIIPADWLYETLILYPDLEYIFHNYVDGKPISFPIPAETTSSPDVNWGVILLLVIWASFVLHYRYQPIYGQSVMRYFINHNFFVDDIKEHRLRNALPGLILLFQHVLLTGLFLYLSAELLLSESGLEIFTYHFPFLMIFGASYLSFFIMGVLMATILQIVSVLWIYLLNNRMNFFNQIINLYSWPLHLNLLVVTVLVVLNQVENTDGLIFSIAVLFTLVWFFSFNIAAIDSARFLDSNRILYLIGTVGLHIIILAGIVIYLSYTPHYIEPVLFAISAP